MPVTLSVERSGSLRYLASIIVIAFVVACGSDNPVGISITGDTSRTFTVPAGFEFSVTLQTIGPGEYSSPPDLSSSAVQFRDMAGVCPCVPAGPTQRFRFLAVAPGTTIVRFTHTDRNPTVEDAVLVR
ncbi:MAG TPA: hypothetical protein VF850_08565 [Gemmatimonadaceae bacterium]